MHQSPGEPVEIEIKVFKPRAGSEYNEADHYREVRRDDKYPSKQRRNSGNDSAGGSNKPKVDPWAKWRK